MTSTECRETLRTNDPLIAPHIPGVGIRDRFFEEGITSRIVKLPDNRYFIQDHDDPDIWSQLTAEEFEQYRSEYEAELGRIEHLPG